MAEVNTAEVEATVNAAFGAGFGDTPPAPPEKVVEEAKPEPVKPEAAAPAPVPEKPQYIRLTKQDWDNTKAAAGKVSSLESQVAKLMGAMPKAEQIVQQVIEKVQSQTPAGSPIKLTKEDLAELSEDFPELSEKILAGLGRAFERASAKGTGDPTPTPAQSPAQPVDMDAAFEKWQLGREAKALEKAYPDWSDIVGRPPMPGDPVPEGNPFRAWLATQPAAYQEEVGQTESPAVVQAAIEKFKASQTQSTAATPAKPDKAAARRAVIEDAVTPRAEGNPPPLNQPQTAEEAFASAFKTVKRP